MTAFRFAVKPRIRPTPGEVHGRNPKRPSAAAGAKASVAYLTREGAYAPATKDVGYLTRESEATQERDDLVFQEARNLPKWAHGDAYNFFESAATYERANGRWALAMEASLPRELSHAQQRELINDFLDSQLKDKPLLVVQHEPRGSDGQPQPHIHVLMSERTNDGVERTASGYFRRGYAGDKNPGAAKDRFWNQKDAPLRVRQAWADLSNAALERAGSPTRVDPRSLYTRGIERTPEPKAGWQRDGQAQRDASQAASTREQEQRIAEEYWTQRKRALGLRPGYVHDRALVKEHVYAWSRDTEAVIVRAPHRWQERHQAWTQRKVERVRAYEQQREQSRGQAIPLPRQAMARGRFEVDLDRDEYGR